MAQTVVIRAIAPSRRRRSGRLSSKQRGGEPFIAWVNKNIGRHSTLMPNGYEAR